MCELTKSVWYHSKGLDWEAKYWKCGQITHDRAAERRHRWQHVKYWWRGVRKTWTQQSR